jgi:prepilin-type N-terminal cleavage/methylation domain-containing protein
MKDCCRNDRGFTLIELLVVVSIIALLASFLLPGLSRAREYAYYARCKGNLKQVAIGFLIYASDNRGQLPEGCDPCCDMGGSLSFQQTYKRIGGLDGVGGWLGGYTGRTSSAGESFLMRVYWEYPVHDGYNPNYNQGINFRYVGEKGMKGKYLPIEILWDPIVKVRGWLYGNGSSVTIKSAGTEDNRDYFSRHAGSFGYDFFMMTTGCDGYRNYGLTDHYHFGYKAEMPYRHYTRHRSPTTSNRSSVWLGACLPAWEGTYSDVHRRLASHFGYTQTMPGGFRFNVVHMDGHISERIWNDAYTSDSWLVNDIGSHRRPYGWPWVGGTTGSGIVEDNPNDWGFDR